VSGHPAAIWALCARATAVTTDCKDHDTSFAECLNGPWCAFVLSEQEPDNDLQESGGYEGISVAVPWQAVSPEGLGAVHKIRDIPRRAESDCE